jgi:hypothetical protein
MTKLTSDTLQIAKRYASSLLLTFVYGVLLLDTYWGMGFTVINILYILLVLLLYPKLYKDKESSIYLLLSAILSLFIPLRAQETTRIFTFLAVFLLNTLAISRFMGVGTLTLKTVLLSPILMFVQMFAEIPQFLRFLSKLFSRSNQERISLPITTAQLLKGLAFTIPLLGLLTILLVSADPLFEHYFQNTLLFFSKFTLDFDLLTNGLQLIFAFGIFAALFNHKSRSYEEFALFNQAEKIRKEISISMVLTALLLALFLFVQAQYLFATETILKQMGVMLSEYTRRGYTELLIVSTICLFLVSLLIKNIRRLSARFYQIISTVFLTEIFLILMSATRRVYLYQHEHGFTQFRLFGVFFSLWLVIVLILFLYRVTTQKRAMPLFLTIFITSIVTLLLMQLANIDYLISVVKKPNLGYGTDYYYISQLSSDAWPGWKEALDQAKKQPDCFSNQAEVPFILEYKLQELALRLDPTTSVGAWTLPDQQALKMLRDNGNEIQKIKQKVDKCRSR